MKKYIDSLYTNTLRAFTILCIIGALFVINSKQNIINFFWMDTRHQMPRVDIIFGELRTYCLGLRINKVEYSALCYRHNWSENRWEKVSQLNTSLY